MITLGLTGSIGMGKTTAAEGFRRFGVPVFDADQTVHMIMKKGGIAHAAIVAMFPDAVVNGNIDRRRLGDIVFGDDDALGRLERLIHPLVRVHEEGFLEGARRGGYDLAVLEIPLLFETGDAGRCDKIVVVTAPADVQEARVLERPGMTPEKLAAIRARQLPDGEKRARADFLIDTSKPKEKNLKVIESIIRHLRSNKAPL